MTTKTKSKKETVIGKMADVTLHTIAKIETGSTPDPRVETLRKTADALGVSVDDLIN
jgi:transcriptional regulator with XRE-family HTH domain